MTLRDVADEWLYSVRSAAPSPHTLTAYRNDINELLRVLSHMLTREPALADFTVATMQHAFAVFAEEPGQAVTHTSDGTTPPTRAKASIARAWSSWNQLGNFLVSQRTLEGNPMAAVRHAKPDDRVQPTGLTEKEVRALIDAVQSGKSSQRVRKPWVQRDLAVVLTLYAQGVRASELLAFDVGSVAGEPDSRTLLVRGKGRKERRLPLHPDLERVLVRYLQERWVRLHVTPEDPHPSPPVSIWGEFSKRDPLFVTTGMKRMTKRQLDYLVERGYRAAGVDLAPGAHVHALRHTFATEKVNYGASTPEVRDLLGHESLETTQRYFDPSADLRDVIAISPGMGVLSLNEAESGRSGPHDAT